MSARDKILKDKHKKGDTMPSARFTLTPDVKRQIVKIIDDRINEVHVTKEDFSELKSIVKDIAKAQKELTQAQKKTEQQVAELTQAQKKTEQRVAELAEAQKELADAQKRTEIEVKSLVVGLHDTRVELGGLSRSFSYAFENEAYRHLPVILKEKYGYTITERIVRAEIGGKEINFFARAMKDGKEVFIVGESKIRLESTWRKDVFSELEDKVNVVKTEFGDVEVVRLLVTHFAKKDFLDEAEKMGVIVVQSYQW